VDSNPNLAPSSVQALVVWFVPSTISSFHNITVRDLSKSDLLFYICTSRYISIAQPDVEFSFLDVLREEKMPVVIL